VFESGVKAVTVVDEVVEGNVWFVGLVEEEDEGAMRDEIYEMHDTIGKE
jgi:hypothetical protein